MQKLAAKLAGTRKSLEPGGVLTGEKRTTKNPAISTGFFEHIFGYLFGTITTVSPLFPGSPGAPAVPFSPLSPGAPGAPAGPAGPGTGTGVGTAITAGVAGGGAGLSHPFRINTAMAAEAKIVDFTEPPVGDVSDLNFSSSVCLVPSSAVSQSDRGHVQSDDF